MDGRFCPSVPDPPDWNLNHDSKVLAVHREVDEEVAGAGERQQEVAQVRDVRNPLRPGDILRTVILI